VLLTALALAVRLPGLSTDLWIDEVATLTTFVRPPLLEIVTSYASANNHVLYSVLAHVVIGVLGESEWSLRLPALAFGVATVPALYALLRPWARRGEALAAAALLAVSYHHAYFSQDGRGYTGFVFLSILSSLLLREALVRGKPSHWAGWAVSLAAGVYMLLSGAFVATCQVLGAVALALRPPQGSAARERRIRQALAWSGVAFALTLLLHAPLLGTMYRYFRTENPDVGFAPSGALVAVALQDVAPHGQAWIVVLCFAAAAVPLLLGLASVARRAPHVLFGLVAPPFVELLAATAMGAGTYPRRFLLLLPALIVLGVRGAAILAGLAARGLRRPLLDRPLFRTMVLAAGVVAAAGLPRLWTLPKQDYRGALAFVAERRGPDDLVAAAWVADLGATYYDPRVISARTAEQLRAVLARGRRTWVLGTLLGDMRQRGGELGDVVAAELEEVARFPALVGDGGIVVWRTREP
jgi:4-amino-4-deoxy-L-arabinose transferase-like glycosyltransferase